MVQRQSRLGEPIGNGLRKSGGNSLPRRTTQPQEPALAPPIRRPEELDHEVAPNERRALGVAGSVGAGGACRISIRPGLGIGLFRALPEPYVSLSAHTAIARMLNERQIPTRTAGERRTNWTLGRACSEADSPRLQWESGALSPFRDEGGSSKAKSELPAAMRICCFPALRYVIGAVMMTPPRLVFQSSLPVSASSTKKSPSLLPLKTSPPAVDKTPPRCLLGRRYSH